MFDPKINDLRIIGSFSSILNNDSSYSTTKEQPVYSGELELLITEPESVIASLIDQLIDIVDSDLVEKKRSLLEDKDDFLSLIADTDAEAKMNKLIQAILRKDFKNNDLINLARGFFSSDIDMFLIFEELLLSKKLSKLHKKQIKEALADMGKFVDHDIILSSKNVSSVAKQFASFIEGRELLASELRDNYILFLTMDGSPIFVYTNWIKEYGFDNRKILLAFMIKALITDITAHHSSINREEFGPLATRLINLRAISTLDNMVVERFKQLSFISTLQCNKVKLSDYEIVELYLEGLINSTEFIKKLRKFMKAYLRHNLLKNRLATMQVLHAVYGQTPDYLFSNAEIKPNILKFFINTNTALFYKERNAGIWQEYYK